jgi:Protein of unknown function (DUF3276)
VAYENNDKKMDSVYSKRIKAGKRRTYFFDVRETRGNDYYLTITESRKRFDSDGYDRHKIFLYKEDFNKFIKGLGDAVDYVKTELMPDFDFDAFNHDTPYEGGDDAAAQIAKSTDEPVISETAVTATAVADEPAAPEVSATESAAIDKVEPLDNGSSVEVDKW